MYAWAIKGMSLQLKPEMLFWFKVLTDLKGTDTSWTFQSPPPSSPSSIGSRKSSMCSISSLNSSSSSSSKSHHSPNHMYWNRSSSQVSEHELITELFRAYICVGNYEPLFGKHAKHWGQQPRVSQGRQLSTLAAFDALFTYSCYHLSFIYFLWKYFYLPLGLFPTRDFIVQSSEFALAASLELFCANFAFLNFNGCFRMDELVSYSSRNIHRIYRIRYNMLWRGRPSSILQTVKTNLSDVSRPDEIESLQVALFWIVHSKNELVRIGTWFNKMAKLRR